MNSYEVLDWLILMSPVGSLMLSLVNTFLILLLVRTQASFTLSAKDILDRNISERWRQLSDNTLRKISESYFIPIDPPISNGRRKSVSDGQ
jgi:hypothetical protein